jgi:hypothetical protein
MPTSSSPRQFWRDGDGRLREVLDVAKCLAQRSGRYVALAGHAQAIEPSPSSAAALREIRVAALAKL